MKHVKLCQSLATLQNPWHPGLPLFFFFWGGVECLVRLHLKINQPTLKNDQKTHTSPSHLTSARPRCSSGCRPRRGSPPSGGTRQGRCPWGGTARTPGLATLKWGRPRFKGKAKASAQRMPWEREGRHRQNLKENGRTPMDESRNT